MIFDREPADWKELQTMVAQAFREMGFDAQVGIEVPLVRGKKEIDVFVQEMIDKILTLLFIECKFWNSDVPQEIVHGFRTVVADGGAHKGYIIAKKGFQSGAYDVSEKTNVEVLTWDQFNKLYFSRWQKATQASLAAKANRLIAFRNYPYGPMVDEEIHNLTPDQHHAWAEIVASGLGFAVLGLRDILFELDGGPVRIIHPAVDINSHTVETVKNMFWTVKTHREWYDYMDRKLDEFMLRIDQWHANYKKTLAKPST
jgi:hypothetical protein